MNEPTAFSLFSGIGGLDLGLARAGFRHVAMCEGGGDPNGSKAEREQWKTGEWRRGILRARFPGVPVYDDVRVVGRDDGQPSSRADGDASHRLNGRSSDAPLGLLCGGFPCQDLSVAGQRRGLAGERSSLFFEYARIADAFRPRWLLVENVPGLLSSNGGRDFGVVLGTLADLGYGLAWRILDSRFFGVPQRRRRVFIVGTLAESDSRAAAERAGQVLAVGTRCPGHPAARGEAGADVAGTLGGGAGERGWAQDTERMTFVPTGPDDNDGHHGHSSPRGDGADNLITAFHMLQDPISGEELAPAFGKGSPTGGASIGVQQGASVRRLTPRECERLQALPDDWTTPGPDSRRYAALGDAVTATVAEWIGRRILAA